MRPKIIEHLGQTHAVKLFPKPVHDDSRCQRIVLRDQPIGQIQSRQLRLVARMRHEISGQGRGDEQNGGYGTDQADRREIPGDFILVLAVHDFDTSG